MMMLMSFATVNTLNVLISAVETNNLFDCLRDALNPPWDHLL